MRDTVRDSEKTKFKREREYFGRSEIPIWENMCHVICSEDMSHRALHSGIPWEHWFCGDTFLWGHIFVVRGQGPGAGQPFSSVGNMVRQCSVGNMGRQCSVGNMGWQCSVGMVPHGVACL